MARNTGSRTIETKKNRASPTSWPSRARPSKCSPPPAGGRSLARRSRAAERPGAPPRLEHGGGATPRDERPRFHFESHERERKGQDRGRDPQHRTRFHSTGPVNVRRREFFSATVQYRSRCWSWSARMDPRARRAAACRGRSRCFVRPPDGEQGHALDIDGEQVTRDCPDREEQRTHDRMLGTTMIRNGCT